MRTYDTILFTLASALQVINCSINYKAVTATKSCFTCDGDCVDLVVSACTQAGKCFSRTVKNDTVTTYSKGCVIDDADSFCYATNPDVTSCYICDGDLCNEEEGKSVDECYLCLDNCDTLTVQNCRQFLGEDVINSRCMAMNQGNYTLRSCVEVNSTVHMACELLNYVGGSCILCDSNLCNDIEFDGDGNNDGGGNNDGDGNNDDGGNNDGDGNNDGENYVDECYYCENDQCKVPLSIHQCKEVLGENVKSKCIAIEQKQGDQILKSRGCIDVEAAQSICNIVHLGGGNCTICDTDLCNGLGDPSRAEQLQLSVQALAVIVLLTTAVSYGSEN